MKNDSPCFNCVDRITGCHSGCGKYSDWKERGATAKEKILDAKRENHEINCYRQSIFKNNFDRYLGA